MENFPGINPDFSSLAETPEDKPEKKDKKNEKKSKKSSVFESEQNPEVKVDDKKLKQEKAKEPPLDKLANDEKKLVTETYVDTRESEIQHELQAITPDTIDEVSALANAAYLENLKTRINESESVDEAVLDEVLSDTTKELGIDTAAIEAIESDTNTYEGGDDQDDLLAVGSNSGGGNLPPYTPTLGNSGSVPPRSSSGIDLSPPSHSAINNQESSSSNTVYERAPTGPYVLVGGIIGYLIGRRGGRIRTEKKLLPVQKKLEAEVVGLQLAVAQGEEKIRNIVRNQHVSSPATSELIVNKLVENRFNRHNKHERQDSPEKLGRIIISSNKPEFSAGKQYDIERMNKNELLNIAQNIPVEYSNVRKLYESNRISEQNLKQIIKAYLNGEKYERYISDALVNYENITNSSNEQSITSTITSKNETKNPDYNVTVSENSMKLDEDNQDAMWKNESIELTKKQYKRSRLAWVTLAVLFAIIVGMLIL